MKWLFQMIAMALLPSAVWGQTVTIRSGEHADFSRLVIEFDSRVSWRFGRVEGGYEIRTDTPDATFDTSTVFALIPRTRIADLTDRGDGRLFIQSDCNCHGDAFDLRASEVVLDIKDGSAPQPSSPFNRTLEAWAPANTSVPAPLPETEHAGRGETAETAGVAEPASSEPDETLHARGGLPIAFDAGLPRVTPRPPTTEPMASAPPAPVESATSFDVTEPAAEPTSRVAETEQALLEQLGRAAAQGLLEPDIRATEDAVDAALNPVPPEPVTEEPPPPPEPHSPTAHVQIQTSIDRVAEGTAPTSSRTQDGFACLPSHFFDIRTWGTPPQEGADLSLHRASLLGEFDQANPEHVQALAEHYLYLTFGIEAASVATRFEAELERPDLLVAIGQIMDHGHSQRPDALRDQMGCDGPVALWAALAQPDLSPADEINRSAVIQAFSELPLHLRRHLGPELSRKFLDIGDRSTANALRDTIARAAGNHGEGFALLEARLDISSGEVATAETRFDSIIEADGPLAPQALQALIEAHLAADQIVDSATRELAASMAFEQRSTPMGVTLGSLALKAHARATQFDQAFVLLNELDSQEVIVQSEREALVGGLFDQLVLSGSDVDFLRYTVPQLSTLQTLPADTRRAVVARLLDLGFTQTARDALTADTEIPDEADRLLFARVALQEGSPGVAMGYLAGLAGPDAVRLRARAQNDLEDYANAAISWAEVANIAAEQQADWLAGNWADLATSEGSPYRPVAALMIPPQPMTSEETAPPPSAMGRSRDALAASRNARAALDSLLQDLARP